MLKKRRGWLFLPTLRNRCSFKYSMNVTGLPDKDYFRMPIMALLETLYFIGHPACTV